VLDHGHKIVFGDHTEGTSTFLPILCVFSPGDLLGLLAYAVYQ
jgi:hypothetical protein